jgi:hypothetical protein
LEENMTSRVPRPKRPEIYSLDWWFTAPGIVLQVINFLTGLLGFVIAYEVWK